MNYPCDKKILLRLCLIAGLIIFCVIYPSDDDSTSTDSSSSSEADLPARKWSLPSLESDLEAPSEASAARSEESVPTSSSSTSEAKPWKYGIPNLESESSWVSGTPSIESQKINAERQRWWKLISQADRKALVAQSPREKQLFEEQAQKLREEFEAIENARPARQEEEEEEEEDLDEPESKG